MDLSLIDEHCVEVAASREDAWAAARETVPKAFDTARSQRLARALGCEQVEPGGPRPIEEGSTIPGFRVVALSSPGSLALAGRHRFSRYELTISVEAVGSDRARVCAETRAEFPGPAGTVYRALVIGTRLHVGVVRRILGAIKNRARDGQRPP